MSEPLPDGVTLIRNALAPILAELRKLVDLAEATGWRWMTTAQAGTYCQMSERSVRDLISAGKLQAHRPLPGKILIDRAELDAYLEASADLPLRRNRRGTYSRDALRIAREESQEATG